MKKLLPVLLFATFAVATSSAQVSCPGGANHCVSLSWTAPTGNPVTSYNIYRATGNYTCVNLPTQNCSLVGNSSTTSYVDVDPALVGGTKYNYVIQAVNSFGGGPGSSPQVSFTTVPDVPGAPTNVAINPAASQ